ncbi:MAG: M20/M25/M40 family metallo-hydrolase, partial [Actinomycetia bacterium]|nr:M20/M25/M40 family metallo-hydrolase [Actinomycetes bacterium]
RGTPGHGSAPYGADNAVETIVAALHQIITTPSPAVISDQWIEFVDNLGLDHDLSGSLININRLDDAIDRVGERDPLLARYIHAATHLTVSANFVRAGDKANIIADRATAVLDIRSLPGMDRKFVDAYLEEAMGDVAHAVEIVPVSNDQAGLASTDNPLWAAIADGVEDVDGHRNIVPILATVATDARFWRRHGTIALGVGLYDEATPFSDLVALFHGTDERVSIETVMRTTNLYERILWRFSDTR